MLTGMLSTDRDMRARGPLKLKPWLLARKEQAVRAQSLQLFDGLAWAVVGFGSQGVGMCRVV